MSLYRIYRTYRRYRGWGYSPALALKKAWRYARHA
jgi:hypothetical protein